MTLNEYMKTQKITMKSCAKELGVRPFTVSRWIKGVRIPRADALIKIAIWSKNAVMPTDFYSHQMCETGKELSRSNNS